MTQNKYLNYYYHITQKRWGSSIKLKPKSKGIYRADYEPDLPRICVAPSIEQCLVALGECLNYSNTIYVFRTKYKIKTVPAISIPDYTLTSEQWILKECHFVKEGRIKPTSLPYDLFLLSSGQREDLKSQKKMYNHLLKMNIQNLIY